MWRVRRRSEEGGGGGACALSEEQLHAIAARLAESTRVVQRPTGVPHCNTPCDMGSRAIESRCEEEEHDASVTSMSSSSSTGSRTCGEKSPARSVNSTCHTRTTPSAMCVRETGRDESSMSRGLDGNGNCNSISSRSSSHGSASDSGNILGSSTGAGNSGHDSSFTPSMQQSKNGNDYSSGSATSSSSSSGGCSSVDSPLVQPSQFSASALSRVLAEAAAAAAAAVAAEEEEDEDECVPVALRLHSGGNFPGRRRRNRKPALPVIVESEDESAADTSVAEVGKTGTTGREADRDPRVESHRVGGGERARPLQCPLINHRGVLSSIGAEAPAANEIVGSEAARNEVDGRLANALAAADDDSVSRCTSAIILASEAARSSAPAGLWAADSPAGRGQPAASSEATQRAATLLPALPQAPQASPSAGVAGKDGQGIQRVAVQRAAPPRQAAHTEGVAGAGRNATMACSASVLTVAQAGAQSTQGASFSQTQSSLHSPQVLAVVPHGRPVSELRAFNSPSFHHSPVEQHQPTAASTSEHPVSCPSNPLLQPPCLSLQVDLRTARILSVTSYASDASEVSGAPLDGGKGVRDVRGVGRGGEVAASLAGDCVVDVGDAATLVRWQQAVLMLMDGRREDIRVR